MGLGGLGGAPAVGLEAEAEPGGQRRVLQLHRRGQAVVGVHDELHHVARVVPQLPHHRFGDQAAQLLVERHRGPGDGKDGLDVGSRQHLRQVPHRGVVVEVAAVVDAAGVQVAAAVAGQDDAGQAPVARRVERVVRGEHQQPRHGAPADALLAQRHLHHGIEAPLGRVEVAGDALPLEAPRELPGVGGEREQVAEGGGGVAGLPPLGAGVVQLGGHRADERQHRLVHKGAEPDAHGGGGVAQGGQQVAAQAAQRVQVVAHGVREVHQVVEVQREAARAPEPHLQGPLLARPKIQLNPLGPQLALRLGPPGPPQLLVLQHPRVPAGLQHGVGGAPGILQGLPGGAARCLRLPPPREVRLLAPRAVGV